MTSVRCKECSKLFRSNSWKKVRKRKHEHCPGFQEVEDKLARKRGRVATSSSVQSLQSCMQRTMEATYCSKESLPIEASPFGKENGRTSENEAESQHFNAEVEDTDMTTTMLEGSQCRIRNDLKDLMGFDAPCVSEAEREVMEKYFDTSKGSLYNGPWNPQPSNEDKKLLVSGLRKLLAKVDAKGKTLTL